MNKVYKSVFNYHTQTWVAVSEVTSAHGKSSGSKEKSVISNSMRLGFAALLISGAFGFIPNMSYAADVTCTTSVVSSSGNFVCGNSATANATGAVAVGTNANAAWSGDIAIGLNAQANSNNSGTNTGPGYAISVGSGSKSAGLYAVSIGGSASASGNWALGLGYGTNATSYNATALGSLSQAVAEGTTAVGQQAKATGSASTALGNMTIADGTYSTALGSIAKASGSYSTAVGMNAQALANNSTAMGSYANAAGDHSVAVGQNSLANSTFSVSVGMQSQATAMGATSVGGGKVIASAVGATAIGGLTDLSPANATEKYAIAIGSAALASNTAAIAMGKGAQATGTQSISIGTGNIVSGNASGAIGDPSYVTGSGTYAVGNNNGTLSAPIAATNSGAFGNNNALPSSSTDGIRVVGNSNTVNSSNVMVVGNNVKVASGLDGAVVLGNASTVSKAVDTASSTIGGVTYTYATAGAAPADGDIVSVGSTTAPRQIQNVANGQVSLTSLDAINGSQLYAVAATAGRGFDLTTSASAGTASGTTLEQVSPGETVTLDAGKNIAVTQAGNTITIATKDDVAFTSVTADKTTVGSVVTDGATNKISGLSAGTADTDAVNVSQLKPIVDGLGGGATINTDGTVTAPSYTITKTDGTSYPAANNVGDALSNLNSEVIKPITFTGDSGSSAQTLGSSFAIVAGNNTDTSTGNLKTTVTDGKVEISMANAPTFTGTVTAPKFMTSGANAITVDGTAGTIGGLTNTTFDPNNIVSGQAATEDQLKSVNDVANKGWNLQTNGDTADKVAPGDTVQLLDGKNIKVTRSGKDVTIATADDVSFTTVTADKTTVGSVVTDSATNKISGLSDGTVASGSSEAITGNQLYNTAATVASSLGGTSVVNADGTVTAGLSVGSNNYTNVQDALSALNTVASAHNTTTAGTNIEVVETTNANGSKNYEVKTKDDVTFNKVTVGGITIDGTSNKISGLADGAVSVDSSDAINGSQLYGVSGSIKNILGGNSTVNSDGSLSMTNVGGTGKDNINDAIQSINTTANKGWNLTANGASSSNVAPGATVDLNNTDGNITITKADNNVTFNLNKDLKADSVTTGNTTMNTNGVSISGGSNGTVSLTGSGLDNGGNKITHVADGAVTADSTDAVNGSQLYEVKNSISDVVNNATFGITAQDGNSVKNNLNKTVSVVGGADSAAAASASNIKTVVKDGKVEIQMVDAPTFTGEVTANGGVTVGDHLTVSSGATVDMGGNKVTNVAAGTADTDAVNVAQMNKAIGGITQNVSNLYGKIDGAVKDANAGIAGAMASAGVPQAYMPGKSMVAASGSTYRGATALAIGVSTITDSGKWVFKGTVNSNSRGYVGATIGAGYQW